MSIQAMAEGVLNGINSLSTSTGLTESTPQINGTRSSNTTLIPIPSALIDTTFSASTNLTSSVLHAKVLSFSDEYFANASNLLTPGAAIRKAGYFVHTGAWYDGWETRRHNRAEYDWVVIKLGVVGKVDGVEVDTAHFIGNEAPEAGLDGCYIAPEEEESSGVDKDGYIGWQEILPRSQCGPSMRQAWKLGLQGVTGREFTHLRLKMYPDGGIARLRVYGTVVSPPLPAVSISSGDKPLEDLASALNGGVAVACSDQHFGVKSNLILPGRGIDMGDGWETARSRTKGHADWVVIRLGLKGRTIEKVIVDTKDFRGNFPQAVKVEGWRVDNAKAALATEEDPKAEVSGWVDIIKGDNSCQADKEHEYEGASLVEGLQSADHVWTHIKMTIIPDGGVKRIRVLGRRA